MFRGAYSAATWAPLDASFPAIGRNELARLTVGMSASPCVRRSVAWAWTSITGRRHDYNDPGSVPA